MAVVRKYEDAQKKAAEEKAAAEKKKEKAAGPPKFKVEYKGKKTPGPTLMKRMAPGVYAPPAGKPEPKKTIEAEDVEEKSSEEPAEETTEEGVLTAEQRDTLFEKIDAMTVENATKAIEKVVDIPLLEKLGSHGHTKGIRTAADDRLQALKTEA